MSEPRTRAGRAEFLTGLRVLELGDGVAGASAAGLLWSLGADVTAVTDPSSPHRRGRPFIRRQGVRVSLLSLILDRGKQLADAEDVSSFDIVLVDRIAPLRGTLAALNDLDAYLAFVAEHNPGAWLTISAFGLTGERANDVATDLTIAAASGMLAVARDERTGQPLKLAGQQSLLNTGQAAALAACHALDLSRTDGVVHLELSAVEAMIAMGPVLEVGGELLNTGSAGGAKRYGAPASFYECTDGLVRISAMEDHQWRGVVAAMGSPEWTARFEQVQSRIDAADEIDEHVATWTRTRTKEQAETILQSRGVPATAVYSPAEILQSPQLGHRDAFERLSLEDGRDASVVGLPFRVVASGDGDGSVNQKPRSLRGLRVLEASRVLAVPLCGAMLGALGAEVTKLEDLPRLDMYRRRGPYIDGDAGPERSAYFALMNHSKRSAAFDIDTDPGRLGKLVASSDVVLENLGPKRATALGLSASSALANHPDLLAISSTGFGQDGPHAEYRAYAYNLQAACGLGYLTRNQSGDNGEIDIAWADLISAYALATIVAAWAVGPSRNGGAGLDFAMADLVVGHFNESLAAASIDPGWDDAVDRGNDLSPYAPHGVYPTADGWLALAVDTNEQFGRLVTLLAFEPVTVPELADPDARFEHRHLVDECISKATHSRPSQQLASELRNAGIAAEAVVVAVDLPTTPQLVAREFFTTVEHVEWGRRNLVGLPWRPFGGPPIALSPPPRLLPEEA